MNNQKQPQSFEEGIYALQKKIVPLPNTDLSQFLDKKPEHISQLNNTIVQTLKKNLEKKFIEDEENLKPKKLEVAADSFGNNVESFEPKEYCLPHLTVTTSSGQLPLIERKYPPLLQRDGFALTPAQVPVQCSGDVDTEEISMSQDEMSSSSSSIQGENNSSEDAEVDEGDVNMIQNVPSSRSSSDDEENSTEDGQVLMNIPVDTLKEELLKRNTDETVLAIQPHFVHAFQYHRDGSEFCENGENCTAKGTIKYYEDNIKDTGGEHFKMIMKILFHHSMNCQVPITMECRMPRCNEFRREYVALKKSSSSSRTNEFNMVYTNNNFICGEGDHPYKIREGIDFKIVFEKLCGFGGFGEVYDSWIHTSKGYARMAIKKMIKQLPNEFSIDLIRELNDGGKSKSPYLLFPDTILIGTDDPPQAMYWVMEKAEMPLQKYVRYCLTENQKNCQKPSHHGCGCECYPISLSRGMTSLYFYQLICAVKYLHDCGMTHGDIKPENILIGANQQKVKLTDFDSLKKEEHRATFGTPGYNAPEIEVADANVTKPCDVYSLSCCLPEMLIGKFMATKGIRERSFINTRNAGLCRLMKPIDPYLAEIFQLGIRTNPQERPTIDNLLELFDNNPEQLKNYVEMNPLPLPVDVGKDKRSVERIYLDERVSEIMDSLPRSLVGPHENLDALNQSRSQQGFN